MRPTGGPWSRCRVRAVSHIGAGGGISAAFLAFLALASSCGSTHRGPVAGAEADPIAAEAATRRADWRAAADRWYAVYLEDRGRDPRPIVELSRALLMLSDAESANNMVDLGLQDHPEDVDLLEMKADALAALRFCRPAEAYYQRVLALDPRRVHALEHLGRVRLELGFEKAAIEPLRKWIAITGGDHAAHALLARALEGAGDPCGAFAEWRRALASGPGDIDELLAAAAAGIEPDVGRAHADRTPICRAWLDAAIALDPQCTRAHFLLGVLEEESNAPEAAIEHYRRAVETDPAYAPALRNLAVLYSARGDEPHTREMVSRALELERDSDRRRALLKLLEPFERKSEQRL